MTNYLNKENREAGICIAGCIGFSDVLLNALKYRNAEVVKEYLKIGHDAFQKALDALCEGISDEQNAFMLKLAKESTLNVVPKTSPRSDREWFPITREELNVLLNAGAASDCLWCDKNEADANHCQLRKVLLNIGMCVKDGNIDKGECPFKGE